MPDWPTSAGGSLKLSAGKSVLGYKPGDQVKLSEAAFVRVLHAFFAELEKRYLHAGPVLPRRRWRGVGTHRLATATIVSIADNRAMRLSRRPTLRFHSGGRMVGLTGIYQVVISELPATLSLFKNARFREEVGQRSSHRADFRSQNL